MSSPSSHSSSMPWQPPSPEALAEQLGNNYDLLVLIGRGGMGAVYRARQISLDRSVAIKVLPPTAGDADLRFAERFLLEARTMARLSHPGIVSVFDCGQTAGGLLYFVMEYVEGTDVQQMVTSSGHLPPEHAHAIAASVCDALAYAHAQGVVHRDIKPSNIIVDAQGRVKVADFGLAKTDTSNGLTITNMAMGTPDYVAPETFIPDQPVDQRADLYAVGVMLYQMLTGTVPRGMFALPSQLMPGQIDPRFDAIITRAMQTNRDLRYSTAHDLRQDLDALLTPVPAPVPAKDSVPSTTAAGGKRWLIPVTAAVLLVGAGLVVFSGKEKPVEQQPAPPPAVKTPAPPVTAKPQAPVPPPKPLEVTHQPKETQPTVPPPVPKPALTAAKKEAPPQTPAQPQPQLPAPPAATAPAMPAELAALDKQFLQLLAERVQTPFDKDVANLVSGYLTGIDREIAKEKAAGHLDAVVALDDEKQRMALRKALPAQDDENLGAAIKRLRGIFREQYAKTEAWRAVNLKLLTYPLTTRLQQLETDLTKQDRIADAKTVRTYRETLLTAPATPAKDDAFANFLGMKFVPVPGTTVLMCIHETRNSDYQAFISDHGAVPSSNPPGKSAHDDVPVSNQPDQPAAMINFDEAAAFCDWLAKKENVAYRLPTDKEWSYAVGIGQKETFDSTPDKIIVRNTIDYPWGTQWPPPTNSGNYADEASKSKFPKEPSIEGYSDGFATTAPVMSFPPNKLGIYDLGGNLWEWCSDHFSDAKTERVVRGGSWHSVERTALLSAQRQHYDPQKHGQDTGFRCVIDTGKPQ